MQHTTLTPPAWRRSEAAPAPAHDSGSPSWVVALLCDLVAFGPLVLMLFL